MKSVNQPIPCKSFTYLPYGFNDQKLWYLTFWATLIHVGGPTHILPPRFVFII